MIIGVVKKGRSSAEAIFAQGKNNFAIFEIENLWTKIDSLAKFERNRFFDPKRTRQLLDRPRLKALT